MSKEHLSFYIKKKKVTEETDLNVYSTSYLVSEGGGESCQQVWGGTTHTLVHAQQESRRGGGASLGQGSQVALGALVVSPFHVSVRNRGSQCLPTTEGGPTPSMDVCTVCCSCSRLQDHRTQKHIQIWVCLHGKASVFKILSKSPRMRIISGELYLLVGAILNGFYVFSPCNSLKFFLFFPFGF